MSEAEVPDLGIRIITIRSPGETKKGANGNHLTRAVIIVVLQNNKQTNTALLTIIANHIYLDKSLLVYFKYEGEVAPFVLPFRNVTFTSDFTVAQAFFNKLCQEDGKVAMTKPGESPSAFSIANSLQELLKKLR